MHTPMAMRVYDKATITNIVITIFIILVFNTIKLNNAHLIVLVFYHQNCQRGEA